MTYRVPAIAVSTVGMAAIVVGLGQDDSKRLAPDVSNRPIPNSALTGSICGQRFVPTLISISNPAGSEPQMQMIMEIRASPEKSADGVMLFILANRTKPLTNQVFRAKPLVSSSKEYRDSFFAKDSEGHLLPKLRNLLVNHRLPGTRTPVTNMYSDRFSGCLRIDKVGDGFVLGRIAIEIPDKWHSRIAGSFRAKLTQLQSQKPR